MYHLIFELIGLAMNNRTKRLLYLIERDFEGSQTKFARAINRSNTQVNALGCLESCPQRFLPGCSIP